jgi:hypothetical protein
MNPQNRLSIRLSALATALLFGAGVTTANATEPCDDFGECKTLIEINSTDGDIGFHFLMDGDDLRYGALYNPKHRKIFSYLVRRELKEQTLTETFAESAEPLCWPDPEAEEDELEDVVTLEEFLDRWSEGTYHFFGISEGWEFSHGETELTKAIPAAPADLAFDVNTREISWTAGDDLGNCATNAELDVLVAGPELSIHPENVTVDAWEVVFEPDVEDGDPTGALVYSVRVPPGQLSVTVPADYLASLPADTEVKIEVGAIGGEDNATFTEEDGFCVTVNGCD